MTPRIGIIPGDPSGIGPELTAKLMAAEGIRETAEILLIGDRCVLEQGMRQAGVDHALVPVDPGDWHAPSDGIAWHETETIAASEIEVLRPAIEAMQKRQMPVDGPWPSDTVFLKLRDREIDAVVTMYHDQGQIALKLMGFERGVTVQGGLPYPVATPAHGTAFDIAGQGRARVDAMRQAFDIACDMVANWQ